jgi:hypothetical protein
VKDVILLDLDGTLCDHTHRLAYAVARDWEKYNALSSLDSPNQEVVEMVRMFRESGYKILILTGRPEAFRSDTLYWIERFSPGPYEALLMRPEGCFDQDYVLKIAMLEKHFGSKKNALDHIFLALEDRDQVVRAYRKYGIPVAQICEDATVEKDQNFVVRELHQLAALFEERDKQYGAAYLDVGKVWIALFPNGLTLKTERDFRRACLLMMLIHKLKRYAAGWERGGHDDSLDDLAVYAMMNKHSDKIK